MPLAGSMAWASISALRSSSRARSWASQLVHAGTAVAQLGQLAQEDPGIAQDADIRLAILAQIFLAAIH